MTDKITHIVYGKISSINYDKMTVWVKENDSAVTFELHWREKPEVVADLMQKQKAGYRVKITTEKDPNEAEPRFWIANCVFDESYKKRKGAYAQSPEEQKAILLQSCYRTGAIVYSALIRAYTPKVQGDPSFDITILYHASMNIVLARAIKDAEAIQAEAKKQ